MALLITFDFPIYNQLGYFHRMERTSVEARLSQSTALGMLGARSLHTIVFGVHTTGDNVYRISLLLFLKIIGGRRVPRSISARKPSTAFAP